MPDTMRAAVAGEYGPPEVVRVVELPRPEPAAGEVLVRLHASTVSIADHRVRAKDLPRGLGFLAVMALGVRRPRKLVLGMEGAGVVEAVGDGVTTFAPGDGVVVMRGGDFGCHAEYVTVPTDAGIAPAPTSLPLEESAALLFGGFTAVYFLNRVPPAAGMRVLVNGASGAVGTALVQLASHFGAEVTAVCSGGNADLVRSLGADHVVDYTTTDFAAASDPYDVVYDCVGNAPFRRVRHLVKPGGALLLVIIDLPGMLGAAWQTRRSGFLVTNEGRGEDPAVLREVVRLADAGALRPVIDREYALDEIVLAHRYVDTGRKRGSVLLRLA
ncbi:NAD(P)-dependent alcohol dehydrogenase [Microbacterium sp. NIBRBAC000506063]|uniref:NAD(P)-dependent alcohol dehydrogenase n=1 Tax=Microbacterium sp. NIBRBAC000506063 TaxID=2734618 RepID=UPI001BB7C1AD|nr:NAD(P)-dependent alcohol dehydrogenase [Microbacterium sp. NIBRBAC000506063]QTV79957.1 NAD(P)-dependent alcohol dehydrogenase [Microbacterium sp. NIBRBAC000506063]